MDLWLSLHGPLSQYASTMHLLLLSWIASLALATAAATQHKHVAVPQFEALFSVNLHIMNESSFQGPLGTRVHTVTSGLATTSLYRSY